MLVWQLHFLTSDHLVCSVIMDKMHLHLLPSMNPDGFAAKAGPTRNNAHDIDLNRDFPDQVCHHHPC